MAKQLGANEVWLAITEYPPITMPSACFRCGQDCVPAEYEGADVSGWSGYHKRIGAGQTVVKRGFTLKGLPLCGPCAAKRNEFTYYHGYIDRDAGTGYICPADDDLPKVPKDDVPMVDVPKVDVPKDPLIGLSAAVGTLTLFAFLGAAVFVGWLWDRALGRGTLGAVLWAIAVGVVGILVIGQMDERAKKRHEKALTPDERQAREEMLKAILEAKSPGAKAKQRRAEAERHNREERKRTEEWVERTNVKTHLYPDRAIIELTFANAAFAEKLRAANPLLLVTPEQARKMASLGPKG